MKCRRHRFNPWVRKIPWRRKWQPTLAILPRNSHGQRSLGYNPWGHKESDVDETTNTFPFSLIFIVPLLCDLEQVTWLLWDPGPSSGKWRPVALSSQVCYEDRAYLWSYFVTDKQLYIHELWLVEDKMGGAVQELGTSKLWRPVSHGSLNAFDWWEHH